MQCFYCSSPIVGFCDGYGCDRPICKEHSYQINVVACQRGQYGSPISIQIDFCPDCQGVKKTSVRACLERC